MSHPGDIKWPGSPPCSPVLLQRAESQDDVMDTALPQPSGGAQALLDGLYTELSRRHGGAQPLVLLTRRRHLLTLTRQFVVHQMSLMSYMCELIGQSPPTPSRLSSMCLRLRDVTSQCALLHRRLRGDPCLYPIPSPSMQDAIRNVSGVLLLMAVKATLLTERFILRVLRRVAQVPAEVTPDLCRSLALYNQVVEDLSKRGRPLAELRPFCLSRTMEILAEERGRVLAGEMCRMWSQCGLEDTLRREMETYLKQATDPDPRPSSSLLKKSQVTPGQRPSSNLGVLVQEQRSQVTPVLQKCPRSLSKLGVLVQEDRREMESHMNQATDPVLKTSNSLQKKSQVVPGQRSSSNLGCLVQGDRSQVTPVLRILVGLDQKMWNQAPSSSELSMYSQYCAHLWPALHSHLFHAICLGMRGPRALPALSSLPEGMCATAVHVLRETFNSEDLPESCVSLGRNLCQNLLCVRNLIAWDSTLCQALSSALTDKCAASTLGSGDPVSGNHSRTAGILVTLCQNLSASLVRPISNQQAPSRESRNLFDRLLCPPWSEPWAVLGQQGVLSRCPVSLHLCDVWLRSHAQNFTSSGSLGQLVLITHGDLPVMKAECRSLVAVAENADWSPSTQSSCVRIKRSGDVLEGLVVSLPRVLGSVCSRRARDLFQHMMPAGRHWRGKLVTGPDLAASEYARAAVSTVVVPVLDGATPLCSEEQAAAVCGTLGVFMEAWMGHILREKIKFSLQGALQLRRDFESVREVLRSRESRLSPEVVQAALALPAFSQADNAIVCLLQQPSRKAYLQSGGCVLFPCCPPLCRVAVDSMSDSLQSLDSLERRVWDGDVSRGGARHSHDSYLPHNQRQWLSLRVHKAWNGLSLPWGGPEVSEG